MTKFVDCIQLRVRIAGIIDQRERVRHGIILVGECLNGETMMIPHRADNTCHEPNRTALRSPPIALLSHPCHRLLIPNEFVIWLKGNTQGRAHHAINFAQKLFFLGTKRSKDVTIG